MKSKTNIDDYVSSHGNNMSLTYGTELQKSSLENVWSQLRVWKVSYNAMLYTIKRHKNGWYISILEVYYSRQVNNFLEIILIGSIMDGYKN